MVQRHPCVIDLKEFYPKRGFEKRQRSEIAYSAHQHPQCTKVSAFGPAALTSLHYDVRPKYLNIPESSNVDTMNCGRSTNFGAY